MNFTIEELTYSKTAIDHNIDNTPGEKELKQLNKLIKSLLQPIRDAYGSPIHVNSGYRCEELNKLLKGSKTSQHMKGEAADITCENNKKLWDIINQMIKDKQITVGQLINEYDLSWIHISLGNKNQIFSKK